MHLRKPTPSPARRLEQAIVLLLAATAAGSPACALGAAPPLRARPPKFPQFVKDVFFPDAREKLIGAPPEKTAAAPVARAAERSEVETPRSRATANWAQLISPDAVEDEIKAQQIALGRVIQSAAKFKGGDYQDAHLHFSVLAALFAIDAEHTDRVRWQREAAAIRDRMAQAARACESGTDAAYKFAKAASEDLENLVHGGSIAAESTAAEPDGVNVAARSALMKRLEQAYKQGLAAGTASEPEFSQRAGALEHESQMVAAMAEMIVREGYEFADDETFRNVARALRDGALSARAAVAAGNYEQARKAAGNIGKACANCHAGYRD